mmetsp:Transcript_22679/g.73760  ORF Transcript_22679/g.73760 Transcript_22679/m.73760 type:complete len:671 (-) Transcript_22679:81-2093(-)
MLVSVSHRGERVSVQLPAEATLWQLAVALAQETGLTPESIKLLGKAAGKTGLRPAHADVANFLLADHKALLSGKPCMMVGSMATEVENVLAEEQRAPDKTVAGFEEEERRMRRRRRHHRSKASSSGSVVLPPGPYTFNAFKVLEPREGMQLTPPPSAALRLLHRLAADPGVVHVMNKHRWTVLELTEMPPEGKVGVSEMCILGYNRGHGLEISLRLRTDDLKGFRKYNRIMETLLHELAHMVYGDHDNNFKALNSQLTVEHRQGDWQNGIGARRLTASAAEPSDESSESEGEGVMAETAKSSGQALGGGGGFAGLLGPRGSAGAAAMLRELQAKAAEARSAEETMAAEAQEALEAWKSREGCAGVTGCTCAIHTLPFGAAPLGGTSGGSGDEGGAGDGGGDGRHAATVEAYPNAEPMAASEEEQYELNAEAEIAAAAKAASQAFSPSSKRERPVEDADDMEEAEEAAKYELDLEAELTVAAREGSQAFSPTKKSSSSAAAAAVSAVATAAAAALPRENSPPRAGEEAEEVEARAQYALDVEAEVRIAAVNASSAFVPPPSAAAATSDGGAAQGDASTSTAEAFPNEEPMLDEAAEPERMSCPVCRAAGFPNEEVLAAHVTAHFATREAAAPAPANSSANIAAARGVSCPICAQSFPSERHVGRHIDEMHS